MLSHNIVYNIIIGGHRVSGWRCFVWTNFFSYIFQPVLQSLFMKLSTDISLQSSSMTRIKQWQYRSIIFDLRNIKLLVSLLQKRWALSGSTKRKPFKHNVTLSRTHMENRFYSREPNQKKTSHEVLIRKPNLAFQLSCGIPSHLLIYWKTVSLLL